MTITAERDAAIRERNMALEERKRAFGERDMAMLERDAAIAELNAAVQERDEAIASLRYRESSIHDNTNLQDSYGNELSSGSKRIQYQHQQQQQQPQHQHQHQHQQHQHQQMRVSEAAYSPKISIRGNEIVAVEPAETPKPRRGRQPKDKEGKATKSGKTPRTGKRSAEAVIKEEINSDAYNGWSNEQNLESDEEYLDKQVSWKDNLGLNQINFDESAMPVPVCSCTGSPQPCYRWGNGGWQSACCTTTISMYPLPQVANKRYSRVGGRKMSGSAFNKLLNRLASEGYDFSSPLDLKDHWAKHGTNRYSTLK